MIGLGTKTPTLYIINAWVCASAPTPDSSFLLIQALVGSSDESSSLGYYGQSILYFQLLALAPKSKAFGEWTSGWLSLIVSLSHPAPVCVCVCVYLSVLLSLLLRWIINDKSWAYANGRYHYVKKAGACQCASCKLLHVYCLLCMIKKLRRSRVTFLARGVLIISKSLRALPWNSVWHK